MNGHILFWVSSAIDLISQLGVRTSHNASASGFADSPTLTSPLGWAAWATGRVKAQPRWQGGGGRGGCIHYQTRSLKKTGLNNSKMNSAGERGRKRTRVGSSTWDHIQLWVSPDTGQSNGDRWLKRDHTQKRREEEEWRSGRERREWVKGQVHSVSLVWLIWRGETTISACVSGPWRQQHSSSALTMACFPLQGPSSLVNVSSCFSRNFAVDLHDSSSRRTIYKLVKSLR